MSAAWLSCPQVAKNCGIFGQAFDESHWAPAGTR